MKNIFLFIFLICAILVGSGFIERIFDYEVYVLGLHIGLFSLGTYLLWKGTIRKTLKSLNVPGNLKENIGYIVVGLLGIFIIAIILGLLLNYFGFNDQYKVVEIAKTFSIYMILMGVIVAPISEEVLFRGFLTNKYGIIVSSLIFSGFHLAYGSITEMIGAFMIGMILAIIFKQSKSLTPCILIHILYNLFSLYMIWSIL